MKKVLLRTICALCLYVLSLGILTSYAAAQQLSAAECAEILRVIRETQANLDRNPGDPYIRAALEQYLAVYNQFCR